MSDNNEPHVNAFEDDDNTHPGFTAAMQRHAKRHGVPVSRAKLGVAGTGGAASIVGIVWLMLQDVKADISLLVEKVDEDVSALEVQVDGNEKQINASIAREHGARQMLSGMAEDVAELKADAREHGKLLLAICAKTGADCR